MSYYGRSHKGFAQERHFGPDHWELLSSLTGLSMVYDRMRDFHRKKASWLRDRVSVNVESIVSYNLIYIIHIIYIYILCIGPKQWYFGCHAP